MNSRCANVDGKRVQGCEAEVEFDWFGNEVDCGWFGNSESHSEERQKEDG